MKIQTSSKALAQDLAVTTLFPIGVEDYKPKTDQDGKPKSFLDQPLYNVRNLDFLRCENGIPVSKEQNIFLSLVHPVAMEGGAFYTLTGRIQIVPFVQNNRVALSITAESLEVKA